MPKKFVTFVLEQFGRSERNSSVQCDCQRQSEASLLTTLTLANHPQIWKKIADPAGRAAKLTKDVSDPAKRDGGFMRLASRFTMTSRPSARLCGTMSRH